MYRYFKTTVYYFEVGEHGSVDFSGPPRLEAGGVGDILKSKDLFRKLATEIIPIDPS